MTGALGRVRTVVVLGGASDIGVAIAALLARRRHATVVLAGRNQDSLDRASADLRQLGAGEVHSISFDSLMPETHERVIAQAGELAGDDLDVVIVAVGVLGDPSRDEADPVAAARVGATNYVGAMSASLAAAERLRQQGHGTLVILSSVAGVRVRRANFIYGSSKAALDSFALGLADSLHGSGVRVVIVRPGFVRTKMTAALDVVPLSTSAQTVAEATVKAMQAGREVVWVPPLFRLLYAVFAHVPRSVWRRLPF